MKNLERALVKANRRVWNRLPRRVRDVRAVRVYGRWVHVLVRRHADREMYLGTLFLRNRPALELMGDLVAEKPRGSRLKVAVLGCSVGVEVYSILWTLRRKHLDLHISVDAVDVSPEVLEIAEKGVYGQHTSETVHAPIFQTLNAAERQEMFDWEGEQARVKPWLRDGIRWRLGDASDPGLIDELGAMDLVIANNFLCHMDAAAAERCLRNLARLVDDGGYLFVSGVDLDVRTKVALDLAWAPVPQLIAEIHDGDPLVRADWPCQWWGLEPLDHRRSDWQIRYASVFRRTDPDTVQTLKPQAEPVEPR